MQDIEPYYRWRDLYIASEDAVNTVFILEPSPGLIHATNLTHILTKGDDFRIPFHQGVEIRQQHFTAINHRRIRVELHGHFIRPAATMVEVKSLIDPDMLIEIEVQAVTKS